MVRRLALASALAFAFGAHAEPAKPAPPAPLTWGDWVGEWSGKLAWSACAMDGAPTATVTFEAIDGAIALELAHVHALFGTVPLLEDGSGWRGQRGDLVVTLARTDKGALDLAIALGSGCTVHGELARASMGIAACDRLEAWARIEEKCTKLTRPTLEHLARLVQQRAAWQRAKGDDRVRIGAQCDARAVKVMSSLIDAGCAPNLDPAIGLRGAECQAFRLATDRLARCSLVPQAVRDGFSAEAAVLGPAAQTASEAELRVIDARCRELRARAVETTQQAACPP